MIDEDDRKRGSVVVVLPLSELDTPNDKALVLTCSWCQGYQRVYVGAVYPHREAAEFYLCLMTGGHSGKTPGGLTYKPSNINSEIGKSECCGAQITGVLEGYDD